MRSALFPAAMARVFVVAFSETPKILNFSDVSRGTDVVVIPSSAVETKVR
jgi:hypothetical protein